MMTYPPTQPGPDKSPGPPVAGGLPTAPPIAPIGPPGKAKKPLLVSRVPGGGGGRGPVPTGPGYMPGRGPGSKNPRMDVASRRAARAKPPMRPAFGP